MSTWLCHISFLVVLGALTLPLGSVQGAHEHDHDDWDKTTRMREILRAEGYAVLDASDVGLYPAGPEPSMTTLIIAGLEAPYSDDQREDVHRLARDGGCVLLLDDLGAYELSPEYGMAHRTRPVLDAFFVRNASFVRTTAFADDKPFALLLNRPAAVIPVFNGSEGPDHLVPQTVMISSNDSYMDLNGDGRVGVEDKKGPFTLGLSKSVGTRGGTFVAVADSGWVVNDLIEREQNQQFLLALLEARCVPGPSAPTRSPGTVVVDDMFSEPEPTFTVPGPAAAVFFLAILALAAFRRRVGKAS